MDINNSSADIKILLQCVRTSTFEQLDDDDFYETSSDDIDIDKTRINDL